MMKKNSWILLALLVLTAGELFSQQTVLRKDLKKQSERTTKYSKKRTVLATQWQVGSLIRTTDNDSLNTAQGMHSWQYGSGIGLIVPIAGPTFLRLEANYRYRNYKMQKDDDALLATMSNIQRYKLATHAFEFGANLRFSNTQGGLQQGKYFELGYLWGRNFANRLIYFQSQDPATNLGADASKTKLKNVDFIAQSAQYLQMTFGREGLSIFGQYRISEFFMRSSNINNNQPLPEISPLTLGIAFIVGGDQSSSNTDEWDTED